MKKQILFIIIMLLMIDLNAQTSEVKLYNPEADAKTDLQNNVTKANAEGKHVLVQIGGNWCSWCIKFNKKVTENDTLRSVLKEKYISYHLNYSKENWNEDLLASFGYPQRFGFPVFVVLDGKGNMLHTQNSIYMEEDKGYATKKVLEFFNHWSSVAIDPKSYPSKDRNK
ncbi:MAG: thioredoxin family protein [Lutibacter sp.]|nr:thioredoxin family protein [Lutibacter sp.]